MTMLTVLALLAVVSGGFLTRHWLRAERVERVRDQARLRVIEGQMAALRAALWIGVAEHAARRRIQADLKASDLFAPEPNHEDYVPSEEPR
jgi:hypothetical protein